MDPSDHLFRREAGRMVATLTRVFGVHNLALAEGGLEIPWRARKFFRVADSHGEESGA